jgi:hypothetical protein
MRRVPACVQVHACPTWHSGVIDGKGTNRDLTSTTMHKEAITMPLSARRAWARVFVRDTCVCVCVLCECVCVFCAHVCTLGHRRNQPTNRDTQRRPRTRACVSHSSDGLQRPRHEVERHGRGGRLAVNQRQWLCLQNAKLKKKFPAGPGEATENQFASGG